MKSVISAKNLRVVFPLFDKVSRSVKARMLQQVDANPSRHFEALSGVSVEIKSGENVGLLGRNGAGKSTFLRTLAGVYQPLSGKIFVDGDITALFDVGVGIDSDASGYDNIPLLMCTRGMPLKQFPEIIRDVEKFTELGEALLRPVRTYSAGMRLRLAFAVATARSSDILLMDEVVGVGDSRFRKKSKARIERMMKGTGTLLLASHSTEFLKSYCDRGLVFESGKIVFDGPITDAAKFYKETL